VIQRFARPALLGLAVLLLAVGCARPRKVDAPVGEPIRDEREKPPAVVEPDDGGGLYAPHIKDGGPPLPPDISGIPEPIPVAEPLARYGNRSPYKVLGRSYEVLQDPRGYLERGTASWYGNKFHGRPTSSFEPYDMYKFTAAHRSLPLPSYVRVTNLENGKSVVVRVNDRGPFHGERLIDLSYVAALKLDIVQKGTARVEVGVLQPDEDDVPPARASEPAARVYLQAASFALKDNAERLQQQLQEAGVRRVQLQRAEVAGRVVWRVRLGPYPHAADLERARARVRELGLGEPQTVDH